MKSRQANLQATCCLLICDDAGADMFTRERSTGRRRGTALIGLELTGLRCPPLGLFGYEVKSEPTSVVANAPTFTPPECF
jgi:hypothetical protein